MSVQTIFLGNPKPCSIGEILYRSVANKCRGNDRIGESLFIASNDIADGGDSHTRMKSLDKRLMNFRLLLPEPPDES